jgi:hypothetical protein
MIHKARAALSRVPPLRGEPIELRYRRESHRVHAGSFLRERRISLDPGLCRLPQEFSRILIHEMFHFVWLRLGNRFRQSFEAMIRREWREGIQGELGWSAERRKDSLGKHDVERRTRAWRLYCCESFCDTAAWLYSGLSRHDEFTLEAGARRVRKDWFAKLQQSHRTLPV